MRSASSVVSSQKCTMPSPDSVPQPSHLVTLAINDSQESNVINLPSNKFKEIQINTFSDSDFNDISDILMYIYL